MKETVLIFECVLFHILQMYVKYKIYHVSMYKIIIQNIHTNRKIVITIEIMFSG